MSTRWPRWKPVDLNFENLMGQVPQSLESHESYESATLNMAVFSFKIILKYIEIIY